MMNQLKQEIVNNLKNQDAFTENNARVYASTGKKLLDMNFKVSQYRRASEEEIIKDFTQAWSEDSTLALKFAFFVRDIREGLGERRLFRILLKQILVLDRRAQKLLKYVAEYGRWDDLIEVFGDTNSFADDQIEIVNLVSKQLAEDTEKMNKKMPISLCAKWLPSVNTSSKGSRTLAKRLASNLKMTERQYRKNLSALRAYANVVEVYTSANKWADINYEHVPSLANLKYKNAFLKHDEIRRRDYFAKLEKGEAKINAAVAFPHDIVSKYNSGSLDPALEAMWKALPKFNLSNTLVVADGSGSMTSTINGTNVTALDVANGLAIYCSECNSGEFRDKYITFSMNPKFVDFSSVNTLLAKLQIAKKHSEVANTDIQKVFKLVLKTAINNKMKQSEMVKNILVISDMQFDHAVEGNDKRLFENIANEYIQAGYKLPKLIFWNVCDRITNTIPVIENENGVILVSGYSVQIMKMVLSDKLDPFEALKEILMSERYKVISLK